MLLDCCDGEVARWRGTSSPRGVYLDRVGHYVAECGIAAALGVRAAGGLDPYSFWLALGLLLSLLVALNKVENDLVHVARHYAGLPRMPDAEDVRAPAGGLLRRLRQRGSLRAVPPRLPLGRVVDTDPGWRHCSTCGSAVRPPRVC